LGEMIWAGSKSLISGGAILVVATLLGVVNAWTAFWVLPIVLLVGTCFGAMALVVTAVSVSYDFFLYYFTLVITPMMLFCGVFFPLSRLPEGVQWTVQALPLTHGVQLIRPLVTGRAPDDPLTHLLVLVIYAVGSFLLATVLLRRRLLT
ncbi:MAG: ABC transporter permease, partial [Candidatus Binatia bacterium]